jgi:hypothetical protein
MTMHEPSENPTTAAAKIQDSMKLAKIDSDSKRIIAY